MEWCSIIREDIEETKKLEYYLAQIALEVRRSYATKKRFKLKDFIFDFTRRKRSNPASSKATWLALLSLNKKKK